MTTQAEPAYVDRTWDDATAAELSGLDRLVYRSNCLGDDQRITNTGGGNTSSKLQERDPITGRTERVLWVKGSGGDLRTSGRFNFASLYLDRLEDLKAAYRERPDRGLKSVAEDQMVDLYRHCIFGGNSRAPSIDTPLHAFVPHAHVDHTHPNAVIAIAACVRGQEVACEVFGDDIPWVPWMRPGFELGLALEELCEQQPAARGAILAQHGLINWSNDDRACYDLSLELIEKASRYIEAHDRGADTFGGVAVPPLDQNARHRVFIELLPWLRGRVSSDRYMIATVQHDAAMLQFTGSVDAQRLAELGTSCPDHFLRTKIKPLLVPWDPHRQSIDTLREQLDATLESYCADYDAYYEACCHEDSPPVRPPEPTVILVPGLGMIAWGVNKSESRVTAEFYRCAVEVMRGAEAIGGYQALPRQEAFDIEYWRLEDAKLRRMPRPATLAGHVSLVIGAGSGIGRHASLHLSDQGATVACVDLDENGALGTATMIEEDKGHGIGVAGTGISECGPAIHLAADVTDRSSIRRAIDDTILAYGGIDELVITAGIFPTPGPGNVIDDETFRRTLDVNTLGPAIAVDEASSIFHQQKLPASIVITTSVNAVVAKPGSTAYDISKAAANHLVRTLAVTHAPHVRVNAVAPATVIEDSTMFPRDRVLASLEKYGIEHDASMATQELVIRLADFYAKRTLLDRSITPHEVAAAICWLLSPASKCTTGQILSVDGGLKEAFLR